MSALADSVPRLHADEPATDSALAARLVASQFPQWRDLPLSAVSECGTTYALYRLGSDKVVRLPRRAYAVGQIDKERRWLPRLACGLPLAVPTPLARGRAADGYPWDWSVYTWLAGAPASHAAFRDPVDAARRLAAFVLAIQEVAAEPDLEPGPHNNARGHDVRLRDALSRERIAELAGEVDAVAATAAWEATMAAPPWEGPPVLIHGDLMPGNLLVHDGALSAVIDFGCLGTGDPAVELLPAWNLFDGQARVAYREALGLDDAAWTRGRGWALHQALMALPYYRDTDPPFAERARRTIEAVLSEPS